MALTAKEKDLLTKIGTKVSAMKTADPDTLGNIEFFMEAGVINPDVMKYADLNVKDNFNLAKYLVDKNGMTYRYFSTEIKWDASIALAAIENTPEIIPYILNRAENEIRYIYNQGEYKISRNLALFFANTVDMYSDGYIYDNYLKGYEDDREIMLASVKRYGEKIQLASERLLGDIELLKAAYKSNCYAFGDDPKLQKYKKLVVQDRDFIIANIREKPKYWDVAIEPEYADDEEIVTLAMEKSMMAYIDASERLRDREDLARKAVVYDGEYLEYISERLRSDRCFIESIIKENPSALEYVKEEFASDRDIVRLAVEEEPECFDYAADILKDDEDFIKTLCASSSMILEYASERIRDSESVFHYAYQLPNRFGDEISFASERLRDDKEFVMELLTNITDEEEDIEILEYLSERLQDDEEVVAACVMLNTDEFEYASERLQFNAGFALTLMMNMELDIYDMLPEEVQADKEIREYMRREELRKKLF